MSTYFLALKMHFKLKSENLIPSTYISILIILVFIIAMNDLTIIISSSNDLTTMSILQKLYDHINTLHEKFGMS